jgi:hypothetical protein
VPKVGALSLEGGFAAKRVKPQTPEVGALSTGEIREGPFGSALLKNLPFGILLLLLALTDFLI